MRLVICTHREGEGMQKLHVSKRVLGFGLVAATAIAALAASTGGAATHTMTPSIGANPVVQNLGALNSPAGQPGRLRNCQLAGLCQGPNQIRNAYGFQSLLDQGIDGTGQTIVIMTRTAATRSSRIWRRRMRTSVSPRRR